MSVVTGVMLCTNLVNEPLLKDVDSWLKDHGYSALHPVEEICCNGKHPQMLMRGGGYNYFLDGEFADYVISLAWQYPENFALVLNPEDGPFKIYSKGAELQSLIPSTS